MKKRFAFSILILLLTAGLPIRGTGQTRASVSTGISSDHGTADVSRHRIAVDVGYSHRTVQAYSDVLNDANWRSGVSYGATYHWMFKFGLGVGGNLMGQNYHYTLGSVGSNVNNIFIGPSVMYRLIFTSSRRMAFVAGMSTGYLHYHERVTNRGATDAIVNSASLGAFTEAGLDFRIAPKVWLGFTLNYFSGNVAIPGFDDVREGLDAFGIRAGIRF